MEKRKRRAARSAAQWRVMVGDWRQSGVSAKRYAAEHGVTASSLWRWSRSFDEPKKESGFDEVLVVGDVADVSPSPTRRVSLPSRIEVTTPSGSVVRLYGGVNVAALTTVMEVLERC